MPWASTRSPPAVTVRRMCRRRSAPVQASSGRQVRERIVNWRSGSVCATVSDQEVDRDSGLFLAPDRLIRNDQNVPPFLSGRHLAFAHRHAREFLSSAPKSEVSMPLTRSCLNSRSSKINSSRRLPVVNRLEARESHRRYDAVFLDEDPLRR